MASKVQISLDVGVATASLTLLDPLGPNNTWSIDPAEFLSANAGEWSQGLGSLPVVLSDTGSKNIILQFADLNMFDPEVGQTGKAVHFGKGGLVGENQTVDWTVDAVF